MTLWSDACVLTLLMLRKIYAEWTFSVVWSWYLLYRPNFRCHPFHEEWLHSCVFSLWMTNDRTYRCIHMFSPINASFGSYVPIAHLPIHGVGSEGLIEIFKLNQKIILWQHTNVFCIQHISIYVQITKYSPPVASSVHTLISIYLQCRMIVLSVPWRLTNIYIYI